MTRKYSVMLALSALILTAGCKKSIKPDSVDLAGGAKAGFASNPDWQEPTLTGRVIRYDINDGHGSDCLFAYDIGTGHVSLTQIIGSNSTTIYSGEGIPIVNSSPFDVRADNGDVTDNYNEVGGVHIIPYDAAGTGHEDHLLMYIPGRGIVYLLTYAGNGQWQQTWNSSSGIGGYDLKGFTDKIISYDYGNSSGVKQDIICYRPGNQFVWVIANTGSASAPVWTPRVQSNGGIGGFDMKGTMDQLVAFDGQLNGYMPLIAYRPSYGYVWVMSHSANSVNWIPNLFSSRQGFYVGNFGPPTFSLGSLQDRLTVINGLALTGSNTNDAWMCYRPGSGLGVSYDYAVNYNPGPGGLGGYLYGYSLPSGTGATYGLNHNPYSGGVYGAGDHILAFSPTDQGNTDLLFYSNGASSPSQLYEWNAGTGSYTRVY